MECADKASELSQRHAGRRYTKGLIIQLAHVLPLCDPNHYTRGHQPVKQQRSTAAPAEGFQIFRSDVEAAVLFAVAGGAGGCESHVLVLVIGSQKQPDPLPAGSKGEACFPTTVCWAVRNIHTSVPHFHCDAASSFRLFPETS